MPTFGVVNSNNNMSAQFPTGDPVISNFNTTNGSIAVFNSNIPIGNNDTFSGSWPIAQTITTTTTTGNVFPYTIVTPTNPGDYYTVPESMPFQNIPYVYPPIKTVPDLESLEEGVYDIPGGKIIIKKIKCTEAQINEATQEALDKEDPPEEKNAIKRTLEEMSSFEDRDI